MKRLQGSKAAGAALEIKGCASQPNAEGANLAHKSKVPTDNTWRTSQAGLEFSLDSCL